MISYSMTRHIVNNALPSCSKVILLLKELKTAMQCLGIKPKAINTWLLYQGHWTQWDIKLDQERNDRRKVNSICKLRLSFLQRPGHKRSLNIAEQLKTCLHSFDLISVIVFDSFPKEDIFFTGCTVFAHLCFMPSWKDLAIKDRLT